ncbi:MAG: DUF342 domain-containing protein [Pontiellaceae bacterium]|nr:DUF342 domain-containing protein [Pontiellaceae bacterium]
MGASKHLLEEWYEGGYGFFLHLSPDETQCFLTIIPEGEPVGISPEQLAEVLKRHKITAAANLSVLEEVCGLLSQGKRATDLLVAEGFLPKPAVPEHIDFQVRVSTMVPSYDETEQGDIDYHHAHLFENVTAGQVIGLHVPRIVGEPGLTVLGNPIPVPPAASSSALKTGAGVKLDSDGRYIAQLDGRVVFEDNRVSVTNELIIENDVDYEVGNIDFVGFVHVRRSIRPGFSVRAKLGLTVDHIAENTHIESDGDIKIGGMAGDGKYGTIRCGGNLTARYLHEVQVECKGNIVVTGEAMNCSLKSTGTITAALIAGGTTYGQGGIETNRLGSDSGGRTFVCAGVDFHHVGKLNEIKAQVGELQQKQHDLEKQKTDASGELLEKIQTQLNQLSDEILALQGERKKIFQQNQDAKNAKINVRKALFEGVVIRLGTTEETFRDYRVGSYSIIEHNRSLLKFVPYSPLNIAAAELEKELLLQEEQEREKKLKEWSR